MGLKIEITVTSTNHRAGSPSGTDGEVRFTQEHDGVIDGDGRYDANTTLYRGQAMLLVIARRLAKLAELDGGPLFTTEGLAAALGHDASSVR